MSPWHSERSVIFKIEMTGYLTAVTGWDQCVERYAIFCSEVVRKNTYFPYTRAKGLELCEMYQVDSLTAPWHTWYKCGL